MRVPASALAIALGASVVLSADPPELLFHDAVIVDFFADYGTSRYGNVAAGDLNGDGITDYVVSGQYDEIRYLAGTADGGLASSLVTLSTKYRGGNSGFVVLEVVDADDDGDQDVLLDSVFHAVVHLRNDGGGVFTEIAASPGTEVLSGGRLLFDFGGDGDLDVIAPTYELPYMTNFGYRVFENLGASFAPGPKFLFSVGGLLRRCDLNDDGLDDVVVVHSTTATVLRQSAAGVMTADAPLAHATGAAGALALDADGDGDDDVIAYGRLLRNDGTGALTAETAVYTAVSFSNPREVDFDRDGLVDVVDRAGTAVNFFRNTGTGFAAPVALPVGMPVGSTTRIAIEDVDGDVKPDVLAQDYSASALSILRQAGFPAPEGLVVAPAVISSPGESTVALEGDGFRAGATVDLGPGIETTNVVVVSPTEANATLDVQPAIGGGERIVTFANSDGQAVLTTVEVHSLDVDSVSGRLSDAPGPARDVLRLKGALPRNGLSANDAFAGRDDGLTLEVGTGLTRFVLDVPAGDSRWKSSRRGRRLVFRTLPDEFPRIRISVDTQQETFDLKVSYFDYPEAPADASLGVFSGDDLGRDAATWDADRTGRRFRLR